jgi:hypothetical protein
MRARGGGAGSSERFPAAVLGSGSPDFTIRGAPGVKSTGLWVWRDQRVMRDLPGAKAGLEGALGGACGGGGGSVRWRTLACARSLSFGHRSGGKRSCARAQCTGKVERASGGVVLRCKGAATAERRWRNVGDGVSVSAVT